MKILAIDDDLYILNLYKEILSGNFQIETAEDAFSGITKFNAFSPDILILDVDMPSGGGQKVFQRVRHIFEKNVPVIFVTGNSEALGEELKEEKTYLLKKPFNSEQLIEIISKAFS